MVLAICMSKHYISIYSGLWLENLLSQNLKIQNFVFAEWRIGTHLHSRSASPRKQFKIKPRAYPAPYVYELILP